MNLKFKIGDMLFYIYWGILMVGKGFGLTSESLLFRQITIAAVLIILLKLINTKYSKRTLILVMVLNCIGILIWIFSGNSGVLLTTITISAMKNINCKDVFKYSFWILFILFVVRTSLGIMGITDIQLLYFYSSVDSYRIRYGLGYMHPNSTHFILFMVYVLCILVYEKKLKIIHYLIMFIYNIYIYKYTDSRTGFYTTSFLLLMCIISKNKSIKNLIYKCFRIFINKIFIITAMLSFIMALMYRYFSVIRSWGTFSSRFLTASNIIFNNNIPLFGSHNITTDLAMVSFLYSDGLVYFLIFIFGYYILLKIYNSKKDYYFMLVCLCYAIYCFSESYSDSIIMNVTLLAFGNLIYRKKNDKNVLLSE